MKSYSQAGQDLFCFAMTEGKTNGTFLDIGCNHESFHSNTYGLEQLGWSGVMVDIVGGCENRRGTFIQCDAAHPSDKLIWAYSQMYPVVDFASIDVDDALLSVLNTIPLGAHTYRVITIETDVYRVGPATRDATREMLRGCGYTLVCGDVNLEGFGAFEDWWCHPDHVNPDLIAKYRCDNKDWREILK